MDIKAKIQNNEILCLDGSMGAIVMRMGYAPADILKLNITHPDVIKQIHRGYYNAGCDIVITNTFDLREETASNTGYSIRDILNSAVQNANEVKAEFHDKAVALGLSPSGKDTYEEAYTHYKYQIENVCANVDMIILETTSVLQDVKAAYNAASDTSDKPFFASMSFMANEHTWYGTSLNDYIDYINTTQMDAAGINCTLTPSEMLPLAIKLKQNTHTAVFAEPNRGQPTKTDNGYTYEIPAEEYAKSAAEFVKCGINIIGGCCGADEECMAMLNKLIK